MHIPINGPGELTTARLLKLLCLLWLAGIAVRLAILAVVPLIPLIEAEMHLSETEIGLLVSLPMLLFAIAAIPGALLVARFGAWLTLVGGMSVAAIGAGARGAAVDIWTLYAATIVLGVGNSVMQPALPSLVRAWLPKRTSLGMTIITSGMVIGVALAPVLTIPFVLPLTYQSWRPALVFWAIPLLGTLLLFVAFSPAPRVPKEWGQQSLAHWWPDWKKKQIWRLGMTYGTNIGIFFRHQRVHPGLPYEHRPA